MNAKIGARAAGVAALACLVPLAACGTGTGAAGMAPATPARTMRPSPSALTPEQQQERDVAASEKTYRAFMAEVNRVGKAGGSKSPTPAMKKYAGAEFLKFHSELLRELNRGGARFTSNTVIGSVKLIEYSPQQVTLKVCEDNGKNSVIDKQGKVLVPKYPILKRSVYVRSYGNTWLLWDFDEPSSARSCRS